MKGFVSYAREDQTAADEVFTFFSQLGIEFFQDVDGLKGGEPWHQHILSKAAEADLFLFIASSTSLTKGGMIDEELEIAHRRLQADERLKFIAIRLDEHPLRPWMNALQYLRFGDESVWEKIASAANDLIGGGAAVLALPGRAFINQRPPLISYTINGCDFRYRVPTFSIIGDRFLADELNSAIRGKVAERLLDMRRWVSDEPKYQDGGSMLVLDPIDIAMSDENVGLAFEHFAYFSTAAHPQHGFLTMNIRRRPWSILKLRLPEERIGAFVDQVIAAIPPDETALWDSQTLRDGLGAFAFEDHCLLTAQGLRIFFPDYVLGPYLLGCRVLDFTGAEFMNLFELNG